MSPSRPSFPPSSSLPSPALPLPSPPSTVGSAPGPKFSQSPAPLEILGDYGADQGGKGPIMETMGPIMGTMGPIMGTMGPKLCRRIGNNEKNAVSSQ